MVTHAFDSAPRRVGDFELLARLSRGGMGEVYVARQVGANGFSRLVALKTMRVDLEHDPNARKLFFDEAQLLGNMRHPAVAQIFTFGEQDGTLYLAMEFIAGVSFSWLLKQPRGFLPPAIAAALIASAARGLHAAHELKDLQGGALDVVHRDVSPQNLMVAFDGQVKVLDFGIALYRARTSQPTEYGQIRGKAAYIDPQLLLGERATRLGDIWSLGVVLHELLTGTPLFAREHDAATMQAVLTAPIAAPSALNPEVGPALDTIALAALHRDPTQRIPTAAALAEQLEKIAADARTSVVDWAQTALNARKEEQHQWLIEHVQTPARATDELVPDGRANLPTQTLASPSPATWRRRLVMMLIVLPISLGAVMLAQRYRSATSSPAEVAAPSPSAPRVSPLAATAPEVVAHDAGGDAGASVELAVTEPVVRAPAPTRPTTPKKRQPPVAPPPAPIAASSEGVAPLQVTAPGDSAEVLVDDVVIGRTPIFFWDKKTIKSGVHRIEIRTPDSNRLRGSRTVEVSKGVKVDVEFAGP